MFVNTVALDWLTLTTWDRGTGEGFRRVLESHAIEPMGLDRRMQYHGTSANNVFVGRAAQNGHAHWMLQASGMDAEIIFPNVAYAPAKCTRIDLQVTVGYPHTYDSAHVAQRIRAWDGPGRPRKVTLIQSGGGLDTVYVGSRKSRRYIRLYVKIDDDGQPWLRFEVEYKRELAEEIWQELRATGDTDYLRQVLYHEAQAIPEFLDLCPGFEPVLEGTATAPKAERKPSESRTLRWLARQVEPAILRAIYDHDQGQAVRKLITNWYLESKMVEEALDQLE